MKANGQNEETLRKYLLGELAEDAQQQLENRLMTEDSVFQELLIEEDELIDEYARDSLSERGRERFESYFLCTPERQRKLRFATAFRQYSEANPTVVPSDSGQQHRTWTAFWAWLSSPSRGPSPAWGAVAATLVFVALAGVWSMVGYWQLQNRLDQVSAERGVLLLEGEHLRQQLADQRADAGQLTADVRREQELRVSLDEKLAELRAREKTNWAAGSSQGRAAPAIASFLLSPGLLRSAGEMTRITIPPGSSLLELQLDLGLDEYERYRAALHEAEGDEIWTQTKLTARKVDSRVMVILTLPSKLLAPRDYYVKLYGIAGPGELEGLWRYDFRVLSE